MGALKLNTTQQFRRDNADVWVEKNPVLLDGEPGLELDTGKIKIGDGAKGWNSLPYFMSDKAQADLSNVENSVFQQKAELAGIGKGGIISATYAELKNLVDEKKLIPGQMYCLTDYQTKYLQPISEVIKTGKNEQLILTALDTTHFKPECSSLEYPQDVITYDFFDNVCEDKTTQRNGFITWRHSTNNTGEYANISAPGDWREIKVVMYDRLNCENYVLKPLLGGTAIERPIMAWKEGDPVYEGEVYKYEDPSRPWIAGVFVAAADGLPSSFEDPKYCSRFYMSRCAMMRDLQVWITSDEYGVYLCPNQDGSTTEYPQFNSYSHDIEFRNTSNIFHGNVFLSTVKRLTVYGDCSGNLFAGSYVIDCVLGSGVKNNTVYDDSFQNNRIMGIFNNNCCYDSFTNNTINGRCNENIFFGYFTENTIVTQFMRNIIGSAGHQPPATSSKGDCRYNVFYDVYRSKLGKRLFDITIQGLSNKDIRDYENGIEQKNIHGSVTLQRVSTNKHIYWIMREDGTIDSALIY